MDLSSQGSFCIVWPSCFYVLKCFSNSTRVPSASTVIFVSANPQCAAIGRHNHVYLQILHHTLKGERASRKSAETKHRRAQSISIRTSRYLDSILSVNQELVATTAGTPPPVASPQRLFTESTRKTRRGPSEPQEELHVGSSSSSVQRVTDSAREGIDVGAAVEEAVRVGQAGGDPVPYLTALYERIGFCAIQGKDKSERGTHSLPTSPSRAAVGITHENNGFQNSDDEELFRRGRKEPTSAGRFFPQDSSEVLGSPRRWATGRHLDRGESGPSEGRGEHGSGNGIIASGGGAIKGYSFAHSPVAKVSSLAERSPEVLERLEALESQLEQERAGVERWYKKIVRKVGDCQRCHNGIGIASLCPT